MGSFCMWGLVTYHKAGPGFLLPLGNWGALVKMCCTLSAKDLPITFYAIWNEHYGPVLNEFSITVTCIQISGNPAGCYGPPERKPPFLVSFLVLKLRCLTCSFISAPSFPNSSLNVSACVLSCVRLFATPGTHQAPLSIGFSRQEYWNGLPFPSPGDIPETGIELVSLMSSALAGGFCTTNATW